MINRENVDSSEDHLVNNVHNLLIQKKKTISLAESCTGGLIAHRLTNISGSSEYLKLGIVAYSNQAKQKLVQVSKIIIDQKGPVCKEVARELAIGIRQILGTNIGLGITGIAGPTGNTDLYPIGTAFLSVDIDGIIKTIRIKVKGNRLEIKSNFADEAFKLLLGMLKDL